MLSVMTNVIEKYLAVQWKRLNVITLVLNQTDNINQMIIKTESTESLLIEPKVCNGGSLKFL
jgi:hypothetical protein